MNSAGTPVSPRTPRASILACACQVTLPSWMRCSAATATASGRAYCSPFSWSLPHVRRGGSLHDIGDVDVHNHAPCHQRKWSPACSDACCAPTSDPRKWATGPGAESWPPRYVGWSIVMEWLPCTQTVEARSELAVMLQMAQSASPGAVCIPIREKTAACETLCCTRRASDDRAGDCPDKRARRCMVDCLPARWFAIDQNPMQQQ